MLAAFSNIAQNTSTAELSLLLNVKHWCITFKQFFVLVIAHSSRISQLNSDLYQFHNNVQSQQHHLIFLYYLSLVCHCNCQSQLWLRTNWDSVRSAAAWTQRSEWTSARVNTSAVWCVQLYSGAGHCTHLVLVYTLPLYRTDILSTLTFVSPLCQDSSLSMCVPVVPGHNSLSPSFHHHDIWVTWPEQY